MTAPTFREPTGEMPEAGKTYMVLHQRKGRFHMRVDCVDGVWASGVVARGVAEAALDYNVKNEGDTITVRKSFCTFEEITP